MRKVRKFVKLLLPLVCVLLASCGETQNEFTLGACHFFFNNAERNDATLASAMNPSAPGIFCSITKVTRNGAAYFEFTNNGGLTSSTPLLKPDTQSTLVLGYNNGIIVGFGALSSPPVFYAFDRECPNCFDPEAIPIKSRPLSMGVNGIATCGVCHRQYDLNNNGFISSGENGKRLTRYRASTTGPFGVLTVN